MEQLNKLSVLILNRNNSNDVLNLVESLKMQTFQDFNIVVIDDNSNDEELKILNSINATNYYLYSYPEPWVFGNDNKWNFGLKITHELSSKYTYTLQTDMKILSNNLLEKLVNYMDLNQNCGAASPTIYDANYMISWGEGIKKYRMGHYYNINETFITRNELMHRMNYINENLIFYGQEFYFINWLYINGYYTTPLKDIFIVHYGGGTSLKYMYSKIFYRSRTTLLLLKIFNDHDSFFTKFKYYFHETSEIRDIIKINLKKIHLLEVVRIIFVFTKGLISGITTKVDKIN